MIKKIAVITGTRAEFGILRPLLEKIQQSDILKLELMVTGMHLLEYYGASIKEIRESNFEIAAIVEMYDKSKEDLTYHGKALAKGIDGFAEVLSKNKCDVLVVFGDRLEPLAATLAASTLKIPIAHIHGGDKTDSGHIDESIRHSITRFAHIHFPATKGHAKRLIRMGEIPDRVFTVGALGLDSIADSVFPKKEIVKKIRLSLHKPIIVCIFNPVHLEENTIGEQMHEVLEAIEELSAQTVIIYPNNDQGSQAIIDEIQKYRRLPFIRVYKNLRHLEYLSLLRCADVLIGNSSSGIIESPTLKLPTLNIGSRNLGRECADNVIFVKAKKSEVIKATKTALYDKEFKRGIERCVNPYGDGNASAKIKKVLEEIELNEELLIKRITY